MPVNRVDYFGRSDYLRCYVLPDGVLTNIPRHQSIGSLGAHDAARGLLVEVCRYTGARPNALFYAEEEVRELHSRLDTIVLTFIALAELPDGTGLSVVTRHRQHRCIDRDDDWTLQIDDTVLHAESRRYPPSPPYQGYLVARYLRRRAADHHQADHHWADPPRPG